MVSSYEDRLNSMGAEELTALIESNNATTKTLQCRTTAKGAFRQEHRIRDLAPFGVPPDDGAGLLSDDFAPTPSEILLAALGSCLVVGIHANAVARAIPVSALDLVLTADMNFGALWGTGDLEIKPIGFEEISIEAHIQSDAPASVLQSLLDHVLLWSPVANSLHNPISLTASLAKV